MEYARARGSLPRELEGLCVSQLRAAIDETPLGPLDAEISRLYFLERWPLADIGAQVGYDRRTVARHAKEAAGRIGRTARGTNIPQ